MAGIGDSWGTEQELLHPRGPNGRWISKAGIAKSIIGGVLDFLRSFRPRQFQSQGQATQYLHNVGGRSGHRMPRLDHARLRQDLPHANADLRDGVIDEPSTKKFVDMMDRNATELPDDVILTRTVGVDAFGFTPETANGTNDDTDPGIRGMSGKLIADRGYGLHVIGEPTPGSAGPGRVRMIVAAKKGTKVVVPAASPDDPTIFTDRDQPLRVTRIVPDGQGGWNMYVTADSHGGHDVPEPIAGPVGPGKPQDREAEVRRLAGMQDKSQKVPDEQADQADEATRRQKAAEGQQILAQERAARDEQARQQPATGTPLQTSGPPPRQPGPGEPPPRTETIVHPALGGQAQPGAPAPTPSTVSETPATPRRVVDLRLAVRDAKVPAPSEKSRTKFNKPYYGIIEGKVHPLDAVRELDRDIQDLRNEDPDNVEIHTEGDITSLQGLRDVIAREYGLEQPAPAKKAAKKAAPSGMTPEQERAVVDRAKQFRGNERNEEETRIVRTADEILARRSGTPTPVKAAKAPAAKKVAPAKVAFKAANLPPAPRREYADLSPEEQREYNKFRRQGMNHSEAIQSARDAVAARAAQRAEQANKAPVKKVAKKAAPEAPGDDLDKMTKKELMDVALKEGVSHGSSKTKDQLKADIRRVREIGPVEPGSNVGKENRIRELLGTDKKPTIADIRAYAREKGIDIRGSQRGELVDQLLAGGIQAPEAPAPVKKAAKKAASSIPTADEARARIIGVPDSERDPILDEILGPLTPAQRKRLARQIGAHPRANLDTEESVKESIRERLRGIVAPGVRREAQHSGIDLTETIAQMRRPIEGVEAPSPPAKKAAKAAVPGAAPGTAAGKITAGRIQPGDKVLVTPGNNGQWHPSTRKTGQTTLTVDRIERVAVRGGRRQQTRLVLVGHDENGNEIRVNTISFDGKAVGVPSHQTFIAAPEPGAAPAKKAAKAAPPTPDSIRQQILATPEDQRFPFIEDTLQPLNLTQSRALARGLGVKSAGRQEKPEITEAIRRHFEGTDARDQSPDMFERLRRGEGPQGHPGDSGIARMMEPGPDQDHQVKLDRVSAYGDLGTMVDELHANEASPEATAARLRSKAKQQNIPEEDMAPLLRAAEAGDRQKVLDEARALMRREGVEQIGNSGDTVPLDPTTQTNLTRGRLPEGTTHVVVVRPGSRANVDGEDILIERATVLPATPDEARAAERARTLVPEGSVPGPRAAAPVDNPVRRKDLRQAWLDAEIQYPPPGSGRRAWEEIRTDLLDGKITPEEAIRRFESEVEFNQEDLNEVDAHLRESDLTDAERTKLIRHRDILQANIDSHKAQSQFLREHFKEEAPVHGLAEAKVQDPASYEFLKDATPDDMREAAKQAGLDPPSGDTADEMFTDLIKQVARKELERKAAKKATKAAKKAVKKAAPVPPTVPRERERVDVKLLAEGLDLPADDSILAEVQRGLDGEPVAGTGKNPTPRQIADFVDGHARHLRDSTGIQHGGWDSGRTRTPEEEAERQRLHKLGMDRALALQELAERIRGVRRRPVKKAAPASPEVAKLQDKVDNLEAANIDQVLEQLQGAKDRESGAKALERLTMDELRRLADQAGTKKGRTKQSIRDGLLDRFVGVETPTETVSGRPKTLGARAKEAGIQHPGEVFSDVDSAIGDADQRLRSGEDPTAVAKFLRERAAQVSKADINEEGRRFKTEKDRDSLLSIRKQSAEYLRRVATHVQQEKKAQAPAKKAPAKKATPPGADLARDLQVLARGTTKEERGGGTGMTDAERAAEVKRLRDRARIERELAGMRQANNPRGSFHHNKGLQGEKDADRLDAEADTLERAGAPQTPAPVKKVAKKAAPAKKAGAPSASRTGTSQPEGPPLRENLTSRETTDSQGRIITRTRPKADEPIHLPNGGADQGRMHLDGEFGQLWETLYFDDREPNSFVNEIARMGEQVGTGQLPLDQALERLARMKGQATDKRVADRIQRAIDGLDAPKVEMPDLPDTVPADIREALRRLSEIPTARRKFHGRPSVFDTKLDIVRRIDAGDEERTLDMQLRERDLHESVDGALQMWRLFEGIDMRDLMKWRREAHRRAHPEQYGGTPAPAKKAARLTAIPGGRTGGAKKGTRPKLSVVRNPENGEFSITVVYEGEVS